MLATKLYGDMGDWPNEGKLSALNIRRALDASLTRLQTDYIDLYQFHHIDRATPWDEIWQAIEVAIAAGQDPLRRQQQLRRLAHRPGPGGGRRNATSPAWSASSRSTTWSPATSSWRCCRPLSTTASGIIPWSPLQGGLLGGVLRKEREGKRRLEGRAAETSRQTHDQIEAYEDFAAELGHEPGDVALAWLLHQPARHGADHRPAHRRSSSTRPCAALDVHLDDKALARLDEIFPGYRTAPEHYAW